MLNKLRRRQLVRIRWHEDMERFGDSDIEILPTLPRVIPFENVAAWEQQSAPYKNSAENAEPLKSEGAV
jgi:hypothetical protein